ncbi:protein TolQ [Ignatzschineria cameli]|uniref:Protein TolQ n=1 Tax=Ignatzschineria cameli TaxID=2182793 RepID=A0A2U2AR87_9GAMM|nr:protein TolQ [Ignatzschineria cameli]PWD86334.1 protein TolQ [Ignatzschineria cameli]PWD89828.1 protein TolQ [Ignatzschineria cameli]PWD91478.1 protein TolQ [Ignatzschineria cameli]PWD92516.1 protein TolQ [Ignatzschineria cameli]
MSSDLQFWHLIASASFPVKIIMLILAIMLIIAIFLIWKKYISIKLAKHRVNQFERIFWSGADINQLASDAIKRGKNCRDLEKVFLSGFQEFTRLRGYANYSPDFIVSSVKNAMFAETQREETIIQKFLSWLATIGSVAPYIGLLGTVIGVMNSFAALGTVKQVTLAQVAPGISEALVATAIGLLAAIPAVMAYNKFSNDINNLMTRYDSFIDEFANILARQYVQMSQKAAPQHYS